jgi:iron complex outermembrane receptor protein
MLSVLLNLIIGTLILLSATLSFAETLVTESDTCNLMLKGTISDSQTENPIKGASVTILEISMQVNSDNEGRYEFDGVCKGIHNIVVSCKGYHSDTIQILLLNNTSKNIEIIRITYSTENIEVEALRSNNFSPIPLDFIEGKEFTKTIGESLGESLKDITGVSVLNTGSSISKPVIHGLYGNRILILNNGVRQEGQQWGSEHAPEVDPLIGRRLVVLKGASTIRYGPDAIAGVIMIEPEALPYGKRVQGEMDIVGFSNGMEGVLSGIVESSIQSIPALSFRVQGTLKKSGNMSTPDYALKNTGYEEANYSLTAGYQKDNYGIEGFFSSFNSKVGIFSGSHIGNLSDLENAFKNKIPFDTGSFSYEIGRPYQDISHILYKTNGFYIAGRKNVIKADYAYQKNERSEFDSHTTGQNLEEPELFFSISTHTANVILESEYSKDLTSTSGISGITQTNIGKGRPFIPNFENYGTGAFYIQSLGVDRFTFEAGIRYDYEWQRIYKYQNGVVVSPSSQYSNVSGKFSVIYRHSNGLSAALSAGSAWRPPGVNELYSNGLHHGSASIEIGDPNLGTENAINVTASLNYDNRKNLAAEVSLYTNQIRNFIYLEPRLPATLTIRGAFPTYYYKQGDIYLNGIDVDLIYSPIPNLNFISKTTIIRAFNNSLDDYLPLIPPDRFENGASYLAGDIGFFRDIQFAFTVVAVAKQTRVPKSGDYVPPPEGYALLNANLSSEFEVMGTPVNLQLTGTNFLNTSYRDYMNRFRYYTDDMGRNISLKLIFPLNQN